MKKSIIQFISITLLAVNLQACIFVVGAAAGAAAVAVVYDHRSIKLTMADAKLANKIDSALNNHAAIRNEAHVSVMVFNHVVLLTGQAPNESLRHESGEIAREIAPTSKIYNQITLEGPTSTLTRTSDTWITTKIRTLMLAEENLKSSSIKVVTENGVVYLMGVVSEAQANQAVDLARRVSGVQKVIRVFQ